MNPDSMNRDFSQRILDALSQRAPIKQRGDGEYRTRCLRPERHRHGDAHPSMDFNPEKGAICRVCGFKIGLANIARELGIVSGTGQKFGEFATAEEAMLALVDKRKLRPRTIAHFGITADIKRQAWAYPLPSGHKRWKAFNSMAPKKYWHEKGAPNQLYGLEEIPQGSEEVLIANGEPAVWICYQAGVSAVCGVYGEGHLPEGTLNALLAKGVKRITIVPDIDEPGRRAALSDFSAFLDDPVFKHLDPLDDLELRMLQLPQELGEGADLVDLYVWHGGNDEAFRQALLVLPRLSSREFEDSRQAEAVETDPLANIILFHDQHAEPYVAFQNDGRQHILKVTSTPFRRWLARQIYATEGKMPGDEKMRKYLRVLEGQACFDGEHIPLSVRVAHHDGAIYYDLGDWRAVRIIPDGWEVTGEPPILFRHFPHQKQQAEPERGGGLEELDPFLNLRTPIDRLLVHVYLVTALVADIPHPILIVYGDQGSGKSFFFRLLKKLLDPSTLETLSPPDTLREFVQLASHHLVVYLDNLSGLPVWLSDSFSRLCTGEGLSKRMLYSDDDDIIYVLRHLGGLNGINLVASKPDLLDRSLVFCLASIPDESRLPEQELWQEFAKVQPRVLGAMFDGLAGAMRVLPNLRFKGFPRMADFTKWACAAARALGYGESAFIEAYRANLAQQNQHALDASPVATALCQFMEGRDHWGGAPSELLKELASEAEQAGVDTHSRLWPKDARWLSRRLREVRPNFQREGIRVDIGERTGRERTITLRRFAKKDVTDVIDVILGGDTRLSANDNSDKNDIITPPSAGKRDPWDDFLDKVGNNGEDDRST